MKWPGGRKVLSNRISEEEARKLRELLKSDAPAEDDRVPVRIGKLIADAVLKPTKQHW